MKMRGFMINLRTEEGRKDLTAILFRDENLGEDEIEMTDFQ